MSSLYGFEIKGELPLRRLNSAVGTRGELVIEAAAESLAAPTSEPVSALVDAEGHRWYASHALQDGRCLLELPPSGDFLLDPAAGRIDVERTDGDDELLEHRIASSAVCTLLAMRSDLVLHASAVEVGGRAVVFCGPSQRGKSTLARVLGEGGRALLGEDGIAIELGEHRAVAFPGARGVRARSRDADGAARTELLGDPGPEEPPPSPLASIVLLGERRAELELEPLAPARALALLTPNLVHSGTREAIAAAFARLARSLALVPAIRVHLPDNIAALPGAAEEMLASPRVRG